MAVEKLSFVRVTAPEGSLDDVLLRCVDCGAFHPEDAVDVLGDGYVAAGAVNPWEAPFASAETLCADLGSHVSKHSDALSAETNGFDDPAAEIAALTERFAEKKAALSQAQEELRVCKETVAQLAHLRELNYDLDRLFHLKHVSVRFGHMPPESYEKLSLYENDPNILFIPASIGKKDVWGCYFAPHGAAKETDAVFSSLFFERTRITDEAHGTPEQALKAAEERVGELEQAASKAKEDFDAFTAEHRGACPALRDELHRRRDRFELRRYAALRDGRCTMIGWIPSVKADAFTDSVKKINGADCLCSPDGPADLTPPTLLNNIRLFRPFEMFVKMYGVPGSGEFDPTPLVAILYSLLYGIMFGDLGQGLLLAVLGWAADRFLHIAVGKVMKVIGCFSAFFGFWYGSVFGYEHLLDPVFRAMGFSEKPIEVTSNEMRNVILLGAVALGAGILLIAMIANIVNGVRRKDPGRYLFSKNGVAGMVFYTSLLAAVGLLILFNKNILSPAFIICLCVLPLILIFLHEPLGRLVARKKKESDAPSTGEYILQNVFEMIEVLLGYLSNTLSFIRVGAFVLSHACMMSVVFLLARSAGSGSPAVVIFGNLFVIALEGLIVGIQVLRLQFFEIFGRFYDGGGREFVPLSTESVS